MGRLPVVSGAEAVKAFEKAGWAVDRQRGSHVILVKEGHPATLSVPMHKEVGEGNAPQPPPRRGHDHRRFRVTGRGVTPGRRIASE